MLPAPLRPARLTTKCPPQVPVYITYALHIYISLRKAFGTTARVGRVASIAWRRSSRTRRKRSIHTTLPEGNEDAIRDKPLDRRAPGAPKYHKTTRKKKQPGRLVSMAPRGRRARGLPETSRSPAGPETSHCRAAWDSVRVARLLRAGPPGQRHRARRHFSAALRPRSRSTRVAFGRRRAGPQLLPADPVRLRRAAQKWQPRCSR